MLQRRDLRDAGGDPRAALPRATVDVDAAVPAVRPILAAVREGGSAAVRELTARFDGVDRADPRVPADVLTLALAALDPDVRTAMDEAIDRQRLVSDALRPVDQTVEVAPGGTVTSRWTPVDRVGLYVPGGLAAYPSTVIMNVVPARSAGVESVALASPAHPEHGGYPHPTVLAACALLGVDEVYAVGGAQAIAMFAYGTADCPRVDLVAGPGNVYVAAAKRLLRGLVGIDAEAGTTEIAVLADDTADPDQVAADLVSQAEHDPMAAAVLITPSTALADAVDAALVRAVAATRHTKRVTEALTGPQSGTVLVRDLDHGVAVADEYAAEHLEVVTANARAVAARVRHAGCVFVGPDSPVPLGDYCAGSNHVLPTGGTARHTSGLSVTSYLKRVQVVDYDRAALAAIAPRVTALAEAEDLPAHAAAIAARTEP